MFPWGLAVCGQYYLSQALLSFSFSLFGVNGKQLSVPLLCFESYCKGICDMDYFCDSRNYSSLVGVVQVKYLW